MLAPAGARDSRAALYGSCLGSEGAGRGEEAEGLKGGSQSFGRPGPVNKFLTGQTKRVANFLAGRGPPVTGPNIS